MSQNMTPWYLFDSIMKEISNTNIVLGYLLSKATDKKLGEKEDLFDCFDGFCIWGFNNA